MDEDFIGDIPLDMITDAVLEKKLLEGTDFFNKDREGKYFSYRTDINTLFGKEENVPSLSLKAKRARLAECESGIFQSGVFLINVDVDTQLEQFINAGANPFSYNSRFGFNFVQICPETKFETISSQILTRLTAMQESAIAILDVRNLEITSRHIIELFYASEIQNLYTIILGVVEDPWLLEQSSAVISDDDFKNGALVDILVNHANLIKG